MDGTTQSKKSLQGPKRVWSGYKRLRVPLELYDNVKNFLESEKTLYFSQNQKSKNIDSQKIKEEYPASKKKIYTYYPPKNAPQVTQADLNGLVSEAFIEQLKVWCIEYGFDCNKAFWTLKKIVLPLKLGRESDIAKELMETIRNSKQP